MFFHFDQPIRARPFAAPVRRAPNQLPTIPPIVSPLVVIAKMSFFAVAVSITRHPSRWNAARAEHPCGLAPVSAIPKAHAPKVVLRNSRLAPIAGSPETGLDFAAQDAPDKFRNAQFRAARLPGQAFLGLSRQSERHGDTALGQFRSGHADICMIVSYTLSRTKIVAVAARL